MRTSTMIGPYRTPDFEMRITREYRGDEIPVLFEINNAVYPEGNPERLEPIFFNSLFSVSDVWIARVEEADLDLIIGYAAVEPGEKSAYLAMMAVRPGYQQRGVGGSMLHRVLQYYRDQKYENVRLHVCFDNPAQKLYFDHGFRVYDLEPKNFGDKTGLMMKKEFK